MHPLTLLASGLLRPRAAAAGRRAGAAGRAVEVRVQGDQVDREDHAGRASSRRRRGTHRRPSEYGFYANVNPTVDHPRWSQATEQRIGEVGRRDDADVQRLRRAGGDAVCGDGFAGELTDRTAQYAESTARAAGQQARPGRDAVLGRLEARSREPDRIRAAHDRDAGADLPALSLTRHAAAEDHRRQFRSATSADARDCSRSSTAASTLSPTRSSSRRRQHLAGSSTTSSPTRSFARDAAPCCRSCRWPPRRPTAAIKWLGAARWKQVHQLTYVAEGGCLSRM